jgi:hypothetical protein
MLEGPETIRMGLSEIHGIVNIRCGAKSVRGEQGKDIPLNVFFPAIAEKDANTGDRARCIMPPGRQGIILADHKQITVDKRTAVPERSAVPRKAPEEKIARAGIADMIRETCRERGSGRIGLKSVGRKGLIPMRL